MLLTNFENITHKNVMQIKITIQFVIDWMSKQIRFHYTSNELSSFWVSFHRGCNEEFSFQLTNFVSALFDLSKGSYPSSVRW